MGEVLSLSIQDELKLQITNFEKSAKNIIITSIETRDVADQQLTAANKLKKAVIAELAEEKEKHHKRHKAVCDFESEYTNIIENGRQSIKKAILSFDIEENKKREAERRRLQAIEDERIRKEKERLMKRAEKLKTPEKIEETLAELESINEPVVQIKEIEKPKGSSYIKSTWKHRVINFKELADDYKIANDDLLSKMATSTRGQVTVTGVEFYEEKSLVSGRS